MISEDPGLFGTSPSHTADYNTRRRPRFLSISFIPLYSNQSESNILLTTTFFYVLFTTIRVAVHTLAFSSSSYFSNDHTFQQSKRITNCIYNTLLPRTVDDYASPFALFPAPLHATLQQSHFETLKADHQLYLQNLHYYTSLQAYFNPSSLNNFPTIKADHHLYSRPLNYYASLPRIFKAVSVSILFYVLLFWRGRRSMRIATAWRFFLAPFL